MTSPRNRHTKMTSFSLLRSNSPASDSQSNLLADSIDTLYNTPEPIELEERLPLEDEAVNAGNYYTNTAPTYQTYPQHVRVNSQSTVAPSPIHSSPLSDEERQFVLDNDHDHHQNLDQHDYDGDEDEDDNKDEDHFANVRKGKQTLVKGTSAKIFTSAEEARGLYIQLGESKDSLGGFDKNKHSFDQQTLLNSDMSESHLDLVYDKEQGEFQKTIKSRKRTRRVGGLFGLCFLCCCSCCPARVRRAFDASSKSWSIIFALSMLLIFFAGAAVTYFTTAFWAPEIHFQTSGVVETISLDNTGFNFTSTLNVTIHNWNFWTNKVTLAETWGVFNNSHYFGYGKVPFDLNIPAYTIVNQSYTMNFSYIAAQDDQDYHILKQFAVDCGPGTIDYILPFKLWTNTRVRIVNIFNIEKKMGQEYSAMHCGFPLVSAIRDMMKLRGILDPNKVKLPVNSTLSFSYAQPYSPMNYPAIPSPTSPGIPAIPTVGHYVNAVAVAQNNVSQAVLHQSGS